MVRAEIVSPYFEGEKDGEAQRGQVTSSRVLSVLVAWPALELGSPWDREWPSMLQHRACARTYSSPCVREERRASTITQVHPTRACEHTHTHTHTHVHIWMLYLRWLSRTATRPWTSVSPRERGGGPLRGKKRKGSGYLERRMDGALSLPGGGVRGTCWRPPGWVGRREAERVRNKMLVLKTEGGLTTRASAVPWVWDVGKFGNVCLAEREPRGMFCRTQPLNASQGIPWQSSG